MAVWEGGGVEGMTLVRRLVGVVGREADDLSMSPGHQIVSLKEFRMFIHDCS